MTDYISRQAAIDIFGKLSQGKYYTSLINAIPAADVVEVVRCKDCRWYNEIGCAIKIVDEADKQTLCYKRL